MSTKSPLSVATLSGKEKPWLLSYFDQVQILHNLNTHSPYVSLSKSYDGQLHHFPTQEFSLFDIFKSASLSQVSKKPSGSISFQCKEPLFYLMSLLTLQVTPSRPRYQYLLLNLTFMLGTESDQC